VAKKYDLITEWALERIEGYIFKGDCSPKEMVARLVPEIPYKEFLRQYWNWRYSMSSQPIRDANGKEV